MDKADKLRILLEHAFDEIALCWLPEPQYVFDKGEATKIINELMYDLVQLFNPPEEPKQLKSYSQHSIIKHVTVRAQSDLRDELGIDQAIEYGLDLLSNRAGQTIHLVNTLVNFRQDGVIFVTVLASPLLVPPQQQKKEWLPPLPDSAYPEDARPLPGRGEA